MSFSYKTQIRDCTIGPHLFRMLTLENFEKTVDELFEHLQAQGQGELLRENCPYFGVLWGSGLALAEELAAQPPEVLRGKTFLELGCGLALPSLLAEKLGAKVTATDLHSETARFLAANLELNHLAQVAFIESAWEKLELPSGAFDFIVAGDVLYEKDLVESLAACLDKLSRPGAQIWVTDPGRTYLQLFEETMKARGFSSALKIRSVTSERGPEDIFILKFQKGN